MNPFIKLLEVYVTYSLTCLYAFILNICGYNVPIMYPCRKTLNIFSHYLLEHPDSHEPLLKNHCLFFCNHRCFSDGFIDSWLTYGSGYITKELNYYSCYFIMLYARLCNAVVFINKNKVNNSKLETDMDYIIRNKNLIVYIEGTRQLTDNPYPIKYGIVRLAYKNNIPIQIVITKNKELMGSFIKKSASLETVYLYTYRSKAIYPTDFDTIDKWCQYINEEFSNSWNKVYNVDKDIIKWIDKTDNYKNNENKYPSEENINNFRIIINNYMILYLVNITMCLFVYYIITI